MNRLLLLLLVFLCVQGTNCLQEREPVKPCKDKKPREEPQTGQEKSVQENEEEQEVKIRVYRKSLSCDTPVIQELPLEQYLVGVVGSEMPASYEPEALKAQAVAARTYARIKMETPAYPELSADLDDTTSFQVYNDDRISQSVCEAVSATEGLVLTEEQRLSDIMYYSTSAGQSGMDLSEEKAAQDFLQETCEGLEQNYPYFRWSSICSRDSLDDCCVINECKIGKFQNIRIVERGENGIVQRLWIRGSRDSLFVEGEYEIRKTLATLFCEITRQDGVTETCAMLPSACFFIESDGKGNLKMTGGGYGHGIGMSQNGANEMAKQGKNYKEILRYYYPVMEIRER